MSGQATIGSDALAKGSSIRVTALCRLLAAAQLGLVAVTWKLWTPQTVFPQVPLLQSACDLPGWLDWCCLSLFVTASVVLFIGVRGEIVRRVSAAVAALALAGFFVLDQHRLQPWAWQFFLLLLLIALADDHTIWRGWTWLVISIYFWSAVSKLDYSFCHDQGPALIGGLKQALGLRGIPNRWTESIDSAAALCLAIGELGVALLLAFARTRRFGLWGGTLMHVGLLVALGPFGLRHSNGVLLWNTFFIAQDWLLFCGCAKHHVGSEMTSDARISPRHRIALALIGLFTLGPALELVGYCDHWLGWAVYSARSDQSEVMVNPDSDFQGPVNQSVDNRLLIGSWSLQQLAVPIYPQHRFHVGVVLDLAEHHGFRGVLVLKRPPDRLSGRPSGENISIPVDDAAAVELNKMAESFFWNARPRRLTSLQ